MKLVELEQKILIKEQEAELKKGQQINWKAFKTNLAGWAAQTGNPENRIDAITWLGIAGHPDAVRTYATTGYPGQGSLGGGADISNSTDNPDFAGGYFTPNPALAGSDRIELNPKYADVYNFSPIGSHTLAHELRHRGFSIIRRIPALIDNMPSEVRDALRTIDATDPRTGGIGVEHAMLYAMDVNGYQPQNAEYWKQMYMACNNVVREWLAKQPIPQGAGEAFQEDLARIYGKPVELVAQGEEPQSDPDAIAAGDVEIVEVPPKLANTTAPPTTNGATGQNGQSGSTIPRSRPSQNTNTPTQPGRGTALAQYATSGKGNLTNNAAISELQQRLKVLGYFIETPGGQLDRDTTEAIKQFQRSSQIPASGRPDRETVTAIIRATS